MVLDNSYIESAIFALFKIDIVNFIRIKMSLAKNFHIQPSEIDNMVAWEYEIFMIELNNAIKEDNEQNKKQMSDYGVDDIKQMSSPGYMSKMYQNASGKMPSLPNMGSFNIPKF